MAVYDLRNKQLSVGSTAARLITILSQDKSVASTAARLATAVMGTASSDPPAEKPKTDVEIARENMKKKKAAKKGKKKPEEVCFVK